jgi:carboxylesterase type B
MKSTKSLASMALALALAPLVAAQAPLAEVRNGTYQGVHSAEYDQDFFLGMPYAQPPVGDLRFRVPRALNESWSEPRQAVEYSPSCIGYGSDNWLLGNYVSEDCLTLNVVRPAGTAPDAKLPVAVWIHGGGLYMGSGVDPRYNTSFIVSQSVEMDTPVIAVTLNYRLQAWGFLYGRDLADEGSSLVGFRDQRLALHWVKENIAAFGGDPEHVTIFGESAGGRSVSAQLLAYGGRDDGLFVGAALQSGQALWPAPQRGPTVDDWEPLYQRVLSATNCSSAADSLSCLRAVPSQQLSDIFNSSVTTNTMSWGQVVDGDFFQRPTHEQFAEGAFAHVPILLGANFDEGASFGVRGVNTSEQFLAAVGRSGVDNATAEAIAELYPDDPARGIPATLEGRPTGEYAFLGSQWKRAAAYQGDVQMHVPRRLVAEAWAHEGLTAYSYHWNVLVNGVAAPFGAGHFQEVAFVFDNVNGVGYDTAITVNPFEGMPETFPQLANIMSRMWISFFAHGDPNRNKAVCLKWPTYELENPKNMVFDVNVTGLVYVEQDVWRKEGMAKIADALWHTPLSLELP